ncbi:group-specific protein [Virgibacillus sp. MG-45]|uniref:group-specific protein n=1 Tax=Virgibacillus sp. MG-45 TaxID=3102791 RepID=UPI002EDAFF06
MKFYIASTFANKAAVQTLRDGLVRLGFTHTYDWTQNERALDAEALATIGALERKAVSACEVFFMLLPAGKGSHIEFGMALAQKKRIILYAAEPIDPAAAPTFYFDKDVEHVYGSLDACYRQLEKRGGN